MQKYNGVWDRATEASDCRKLHVMYSTLSFHFYIVIFSQKIGGEHQGCLLDSVTSIVNNFIYLFFSPRMKERAKKAAAQKKEIESEQTNLKVRKNCTDILTCITY